MREGRGAIAAPQVGVRQVRQPGTARRRPSAYADSPNTAPWAEVQARDPSRSAVEQAVGRSERARGDRGAASWGSPGASAGHGAQASFRLRGQSQHSPLGGGSGSRSISERSGAGGGEKRAGEGALAALHDGGWVVRSRARADGSLPWTAPINTVRSVASTGTMLR